MRKSVLIGVMVLLCVAAGAQSGQKGRRTASTSKEAEMERQISSRFNAGLRAYYTAQYEEAMQVFSGILTDAPKHAPSYFMLARVYVVRQQYSEAEIALHQAVKLDKNNIWYQIPLAKSYLTTENYKSALPLWEKICRQMPNNVEYLSALATCYEKTGKPDKATEVRNRIVQLEPASEGDRQNPVPPVAANGAGDHKSQGLASLKAQQYEQAVAQLEQALREDDTDYDLWSAYAEAVTKSGKWTKLTEYEEDMTTLFPQSPALLCALANAFLRTGHPDKALEYYQQARAFAFDSAQIQQIRKGLYDAYTALGDTENAERYR